MPEIPIALRASYAAAARIEDYGETLRGHRVLHLTGKGNRPATLPITVPVLRVRVRLEREEDGRIRHGKTPCGDIAPPGPARR